MQHSTYPNLQVIEENTVTPQDVYELLKPFFLSKEMAILERFANLSRNAIFTKPQDTDLSSVFIPGTRKDRVLLVAHVDTVWHDSPNIKVGYGENNHNFIYSKNRHRGLDSDGNPVVNGLGIGADDRAGVGLLWMYRNLGHSLLLVNSEERGTMGSRYLMSNLEMAARIQGHQFAIEFDRHNGDEIVFYNVASKKFKEYVSNETKYYTCTGTWTDICVLCKDICGVNISVGYAKEHTMDENLNVNDWLTTYKTVGTWLCKKELPRFTQ